MSRTRIFVEALELEASIGVLEHEFRTAQPLTVDVSMEVESGGTKTGVLETTVDYREPVRRARDLAARGHIRLVEDFAERLAAACLEDPRVVQVTIRVRKPNAVASARAAGVEITRSRN